MEKKYDLTKKNVLDYVLQLNPILFVAKKAFDSIFDSNTTTKQIEAAKTLIEQGKKDGVDEMEITIDNTKGFKLNVPTDGVKIDACLGSNDKMTHKVKYK